MCVLGEGVPLSSDGESLCENEAKTKRNGQEKEVHGDIFECLYLATMMGKRHPLHFLFLKKKKKVVLGFHPLQQRILSNHF